MRLMDRAGLDRIAAIDAGAKQLGRQAGCHVGTDRNPALGTEKERFVAEHALQTP